MAYNPPTNQTTAVQDLSAPTNQTTAVQVFSAPTNQTTAVQVFSAEIYNSHYDLESESDIKRLQERLDKLIHDEMLWRFRNQSPREYPCYFKPCGVNAGTWFRSAEDLQNYVEGLKAAITRAERRLQTLQDQPSADQAIQPSADQAISTEIYNLSSVFESESDIKRLQKRLDLFIHDERLWRIRSECPRRYPFKFKPFGVNAGAYFHTADDLQEYVKYLQATIISGERRLQTLQAAEKHAEKPLALILRSPDPFASPKRKIDDESARAEEPKRICTVQNNLCANCSTPGASLSCFETYCCHLYCDKKCRHTLKSSRHECKRPVACNEEPCGAGSK